LRTAGSRTGWSEAGESIGKHRRRARLPAPIKRHEDDVIAALVASAVQNHERTTAIARRKVVAGIEHQVQGGRTTGVKGQHWRGIDSRCRRSLAVTAIFWRDEADIPQAVIVRIRPAQIGAFDYAMHLVSDVVVVFGADHVGPG